MQAFEKLKQKWGIASNLQVILILIVFSLAGSTSVALKNVYYQILGIDQLTPAWLRTTTYLVFLFPTYQALLLAYGFIFGQFKFFWEKEKKLIKLIFRKKGSKISK